MGKKRIFISFDYDNDRAYKNLLLAWDAHDDFDFEFYDASLKVGINSEDANYVKSRIRPKIQASTHLLCIVGKYCSSNEWIAWEIERAVEYKKKLIGVKIEKAFASPLGLLANGASWALSFNFEAIKKAVDSA